MSVCSTPGCPFLAHTQPREGFDGFCCIACAEGRGREHGPRCERIPAAVAGRPRPSYRGSLQTARTPLCYYFSPSRDGLLRDIEGAYLNARFGPGSLPRTPAPESRTPQSFMLLVSHGASNDSFPVVAHAYHLLASRGLPPSVLIVGTDHGNVGAPVALSARPWRTPLGQVEVDSDLLGELRSRGFCVDEKGHSQEHSIENQLPFLQHLAPGVKVLPLSIGWISVQRAKQVAQDVVAVTSGRPVLIIATTDYLHAGEGYYDQPPRGEGLHAFIRRRDEPVLAAIRECSPEATVSASGHRGMCGLWPTVVFLYCAQLQGFTQAELLKYAVSGEVSRAPGCCGFASWVFREPDRAVAAQGSLDVHWSIVD